MFVVSLLNHVMFLFSIMLSKIQYCNFTYVLSLRLDILLDFLFYSTGAGIVLCGGRKKSPHTLS